MSTFSGIKIKSESRLRESDKKRLINKFLSQNNVTSYRNVVFPDRLGITKVSVIMRDGKEEALYCSSGLPIMFTYGDRLLPTLFMLWCFPICSKGIPITEEGLDSIKEGKGIQDEFVVKNNPAIKFNFNAKDHVFAFTEKNSSAFAVGLATKSSNQLLNKSRKECAVFLHHYGDDLYAYGRSEFPGENTVVRIWGLDPEPKGPEMADRYDPGPFGEMVKYYLQSPDLFRLSASEAGPLKIGEASNLKDLGPELQMDILLCSCFLKALNGMRQCHFPMLVSTFYKVHMIPLCPVGAKLDVKVSSYKKFSNFIAKMVQEHLITVIESSPGVQSISKVNFTHRAIISFIEIPEMQFNSIDHDKPIDTNAFKVVEKYVVKPKVLPVFSKFGMKKDSLLLENEARSFIGRYIMESCLSERSGEVRLDEVLKKLFGLENNLRFVRMEWEVVIGKILEKMAKRYEVISYDDKGNEIIHNYEGNLPKIVVKISRKSGNKKVTFVTNLSHYNIDLEAFAKRCQVDVGASAGVEKATSEVFIQGNQVEFVENILTETYFIPKKFLVGLEGAAKGKKSGRK